MSILDQFLNITGVDFKSGKRDVQPIKEAAKKMDIKDLTQIADAYGGLEKIPENLKPISDIKKQGGYQVVESPFNIAGVGKDEKVIQKVGADMKPVYEIVGKDAPRAGIPRLAAGAIDLLTRNKFDLDKRGKDGKSRTLDLTDPSTFLVSQAQKSQIASALESAGVDTTGGTTGAIPEAKAMLDFYEQNADRIRNVNRDLARGAAFDEAANYAITEPIRQKFLRDAVTFKQKQLLEAEKIKQALPNAVQNRLLTADAGFATQAGAIAGQQDSATRFAGLGMQRPFGQPTFRVG
tara:strand:- start:192 stop:1070 length:879 start_codon:yes stop_codon:yes gene_type:complete